MFKCNHCGEVLEEPAVWKESRGECWGEIVFEECGGCPNCYRGYEEAERCSVCGEYFLIDELNDGICDSCVKESIDDMDYAKAFEFLAEADDFEYFFLKFYFTQEFFEEPEKELSNEFRQLFKRKILSDKLNGNQNFLDSLKKFVKEHSFFEWVNFMQKGVSE